MRPALPALLLGATCIALSPIFVRLSEAGPTATAFWRTALALPILWPLFFVQKASPAAASAGTSVLLVAAGLAFAGDLAFWHAAIGLTSVANSTLLANLASIFVTDGFGVVTALFYAGYLLAVKALRDRARGTLLVMAATSTITTAALLPVALASGERLAPLTARGWLDLLGLALVSHAAGQGLIAYALAHLPAAFSSVSLLLQPVMAALFAWALLS